MTQNNRKPFSFGNCNFETQENTDDYSRSLEFIKNQIEFYLSDSNLIRDDFFHELVLSNSKGMIPLEIFVNCNRIKKQLHQLRWCQMDNIKIIQKAIKLSDNLRLNSSKTGVSRIIKYDAILESEIEQKSDAKMIYIENLDVEITEKDLYKIFIKFGEIQKIKLTKIKIKESEKCAFIEFENEESAIEALDYNNQIPFEMMKIHRISKKPLRILNKKCWNGFKNELQKV